MTVQTRIRVQPMALLEKARFFSSVIKAALAKRIGIMMRKKRKMKRKRKRKRKREKIRMSKTERKRKRDR